VRGSATYNCPPLMQVSQTHAGLPLVELEDRAVETRRVHVFGPRFALQAEGYEPVVFTSPAIE
jgi:hypothetical protein